jgi:hypothetical protein
MNMALKLCSEMTAAEKLQWNEESYWETAAADFDRRINHLCEKFGVETIVNMLGPWETVLLNEEGCLIDLGQAPHFHIVETDVEFRSLIRYVDAMEDRLIANALNTAQQNHEKAKAIALKVTEAMKAKGKAKAKIKTKTRTKAKGKGKAKAKAKALQAA